MLVGNFTVEGQERRDGIPERYEIAEVTKLTGNRWRFEARVKYGDTDVTLPMVLPVEWAGDTPIVSITDFAIPGLGDEFGARVVFLRRALRRHVGPRPVRWDDVRDDLAAEVSPGARGAAASSRNNVGRGRPTLRGRRPSRSRRSAASRSDNPPSHCPPPCRTPPGPRPAPWPKRSGALS